MRRPQGYVTITDPDRPLVELDTFTCGHCQAIVQVPPRADASALGGFCRMCMRLVCPRCADGACDPFEKKLERMEAVRQYGT